MLQPVEIGDDAVADAEGALRRLDQPVIVRRALGLADGQSFEKAEDDQGGHPLRRRRKVEELGVAPAQGERYALPRAVGFEIGAGDRGAEAFEIRGDLAADIAAVEIVEPGMDELCG